MSEILGIDLGTTNSVMAVLRGEKPEIIPNFEGERLTPSAVFFKAENILLVGEAAKAAALRNSGNSVLSIKRKMGSDYKVRINGRVLSPQEISSYILLKLKLDAEEYLGEKIKKAVITCPAYFNDKQRQATYEAGELAGLEVIRIINEPTAASLAYGMDKQDIQTVLVWDLGGGTFDVSILELGDGFFEVKAVNGNTNLGGDDWDQRLVSWIMEEVQQRRILYSEDATLFPKLRDAAEKAKIDLSLEIKTAIKLPFLNHDKEKQLTLTREKFEHLTSDLAEKMIQPTLQALFDAGFSPEEIDRVVFVGGATRMPAVHKLAVEMFKKEPIKDVNPDEVVALGAAVQAGILKGDYKKTVLVDVNPLSLGIETQGGIFTRLIKRNTPIPTSHSRVFTTSRDDQMEVSICVLQGEREIATENLKIGELILSDIDPAPRGIPKIEVIFHIDANGILNVTGKDLHTAIEKGVKIKAPALSFEEIEARTKAAAFHALEDSEKKEEIEEKIRAVNSIQILEELLQNKKLKMREVVQREIRELKRLLQRGTKEELKSKIVSLPNLIGRLV
ncbi:MAG: molecular chaperone DnaK [Chloroflexi bacterium]|nr:molecular chaperone DnaK [Chloroflexota bacterium]